MKLVAVVWQSITKYYKVLHNSSSNCWLASDCGACLGQKIFPPEADTHHRPETRGNYWRQSHQCQGMCLGKLRPIVSRLILQINKLKFVFPRGLSNIWCFNVLHHLTVRVYCNTRPQSLCGREWVWVVPRQFSHKLNIRYFDCLSVCLLHWEMITFHEILRLVSADQFSPDSSQTVRHHYH